MHIFKAIEKNKISKYQIISIRTILLLPLFVITTTQACQPAAEDCIDLSKEFQITTTGLDENKQPVFCISEQENATAPGKCYKAQKNRLVAIEKDSLKKLPHNNNILNRSLNHVYMVQNKKQETRDVSFCNHDTRKCIKIPRAKLKSKLPDIIFKDILKNEFYTFYYSNNSERAANETVIMNSDFNEVGMLTYKNRGLEPQAFLGLSENILGIVLCAAGPSCGLELFNKKTGTQTTFKNGDYFDVYDGYIEQVTDKNLQKLFMVSQSAVQAVFVDLKDSNKNIWLELVKEEFTDPEQRYAVLKPAENYRYLIKKTKKSILVYKIDMNLKKVQWFTQYQVCSIKK